MNELYDIIKKHAQMYPKMEPVDAVKLVFQNVFGPGHMIDDEEEARHRLRAEFNKYRVSKKSEDKRPELPEVIYVGNGFMRVELTSVNDKKFPLFAVWKMFFATANDTAAKTDEEYKAKRTEFEEKIATLRKLVEEGVFYFDVKSFDDFYKDYTSHADENGRLPIPSHSDGYRALYHPSYRLVSAEYEPLFTTISKIYLALKAKGHINVAIEGRAASGKSTAARRLDDIFDVNIIHTMDFLCPSEKCTKSRLEEAGGIFDYERFATEVVDGIRGAKPFIYRPFDVNTQKFGEPVKVFPRPVTIVEGAYGMHPNVGNIYDLHIFMTVLKKEQNLRILNRDGEEKLKEFIKNWVPLENRYFEAFSIREHCEIIIMNAKEGQEEA